MEVKQLYNDTAFLPQVTVDHSLLVMHYLVPRVELLYTKPGGVKRWEK